MDGTSPGRNGSELSSWPTGPPAIDPFTSSSACFCSVFTGRCISSVLLVRQKMTGRGASHHRGPLCEQGHL